VLRADAERLGIQWRDPTVYYKGDGEDPEYPPPDGWRELLAAQAARLGWYSIYAGPVPAASGDTKENDR
jgi:hypothetical protein